MPPRHRAMATFGRAELRAGSSSQNFSGRRPLPLVVGIILRTRGQGRLGGTALRVTLTAARAKGMPCHLLMLRRAGVQSSQSSLEQGPPLRFHAEVHVMIRHTAPVLGYSAPCG
jgi:hypothetical protein